MELPREPTALPQARRYNRKFHAQQGKAFMQQDKIVIQIPRISNTYLTKDVKLHFDFDMSYLEASSTTWEAIASDLISNGFPTDDSKTLLHITNYFNRKSNGGVSDEPNRPINAYTKPTPSFDINGPYGLISRIQVYDYLGSTLLEDIPSHEVLTAQFADVWFDKENVDIDRPRQVVGEEKVVRKHPCSGIFPSFNLQELSPVSVKEFSEVFSNFKVQSYTIIPAPVVIPTLHCHIDLFSFLGRLSDKFVPLHNGFQLVLTLSDFTDAIAFNTPFGDNTVYYRRFNRHTKLITGNVSDSIIINSTNDMICFSTDLDVDSPFHYVEIPHNTYSRANLAIELTKLLRPFVAVGIEVNGSEFYFRFESTAAFTIHETSSILSTISLSTGVDHNSSYDPHFWGYHHLDSSITSAKISNVYIDSDLLEITPELDSKVDKIVYAQGWKYQKDFFPYRDFAKYNTNDGYRTPFIRRIIPDLKSITKVYVGQRPVVYNKSTGRQRLGFRIKNYLESGRLLYNKTEVSSIESLEEAYTHFKSSLGKGLDDYLTIRDFETEEEIAYGTNGNQMKILPPENESSFLSDPFSIAYSPTGWWPGMRGIAQELGVNGKESFFSQLTTFDQGRFLLAFDARIPGATANSIAGIDTTKSVLEYEIKSSSDVCHKVNIDVFVEHDSFIFVDPGKSTSVSF